MKLQLEHGRPLDETGRQSREMRRYDLPEKFLPAVCHSPRRGTGHEG